MVEKTLKLILDKLDNLDQKVTNLDQKVNNLDQKVTNLDHEQKRQADLLQQLINTVAATNVSISKTNERIDSLEYKVEILTNDIKEIKTSMATKKDLEYYDQMISEHSREIYKLKNN